MDLREKIARAGIAEVSRQTEGRWPHDGDTGLDILIDDDIDFGKLADAILALPEIREALELKERNRDDAIERDLADRD